MSNDLTPDPLGDVAGQLNAEHEHFEAALECDLQHAKAAGDLPVQAKALLPHGQWLAWLRENCPCTARTAQRYMLIAERWGELVKNDTVPHLPFQQSLKIFTHKGGEDTPGDASKPAASSPARGQRRWLEQPPETRRRLVTRYWDLLAGYAVLFDAAGWTAEAIADSMGRPAHEVDLILHPFPPARFDHERNGSDLFRPVPFRREVQRSYRNEVARLHALWLGSAYLMAAYNAKREGFPELTSGLGATGRHHLKAATRQKGTPSLFELEWDDQHHQRVAWCCAGSDARAGMGIDLAEEYFLSLWAKWDRICRSLPA